MRREIDGIVYDTAYAKVIASHQAGSTHVHRMSSLYQAANGAYFLVEEHDIHGVDGALLTPLSEALVREWLERQGKPEAAGLPVRDGRSVLRVEIDSDLLPRIAAAADAAGLSEQAWVLNAIMTALARAGMPEVGQSASREQRPAETG